MATMTRFPCGYSVRNVIITWENTFLPLEKKEES